MKNSELIQGLISQTESHLERAKVLYNLPEEKLSEKPNGKWNIMECCEHLNLYFEYYLPLISDKIQTESFSVANFKPGIVGNYFAKSMLSKTNKMKTATDKNPLYQYLTKQSIENLIQNLERFISVLEISKTKNLNEIRITTSFSKLIKLKLGDMLSFITNHNERHLQQAEKLI